MARPGQSLLFGTIFLLFTNILIKGLGFFYRVVLVRLLGAEGMGLIEMAIPIYSFLLVVAGWGLPLAISQSIAESTAKNRLEEAFSIFKSGRLILFISGLSITIIAYAALPLLIKYIAPDKRIYPCLKALLPAVIVISTASAYRGYFQGFRQISALGLSQLAEQIARVACGLFLVKNFLALGLEKSATAYSYGALIGELAGFAFLLWSFSRSKSQIKQMGIISGRQIFSLFKFGTPVTFTRLIISAIMMLEAVLIPLALQKAGWDMRAATEIYGRFAGVAKTLLHLPSVFTGALAVSVLPAVAQSGLGNIKLLKNRAANSLQATVIFTLPGMFLLGTFAKELCTWVFHSPLAAEPLKILAWGGCFLYMQTTVISILQGLGEVKLLLFNSMLAGFCFILGIILLTPLPYLGINGAALATNIYYLTGFALNYLLFKRVTKIRLPWVNIFIKPVLSGLLGLGAIKLSAPFISELLGGRDKLYVFTLCLIFIFTYFLILIAGGGLSIGVWRRFKNRKT